MDDTLLRLETAMWAAATRADPDWMTAHLAPDFVEFGRSGRRYGRDDIIDLPVGDLSDVTLTDLRSRMLSDDVALVTYRSVRGDDHSHRASVWRRHPDGWMLEFHQGTPTTP